MKQAAPAKSLDEAIASLLKTDEYSYWAVDVSGEMYLYKSMPMIHPLFKTWMPSQDTDFPQRYCKIDMANQPGPGAWRFLIGEIPTTQEKE